MAKPKTSTEHTTVRRITAADDAKPTKKARPVTAEVAAPARTNRRPNLILRLAGYFKGAWTELRQVRWPNRRATWGLTAALLIFTALFVGFIMLVDLLWEYLFKLILR